MIVQWGRTEERGLLQGVGSMGDDHPLGRRVGRTEDGICGLGNLELDRRVLG